VLTVNVETVGGAVILRCQGRIVRGDETPILCAAVQQRGWNVVLDLSGVEAIDAAGVGALVSLQAAGIYLKLLNPSKQVREVLTLTKLDSIFEVSESEPLDATLGKPGPSEFTFKPGVAPVANYL